MALPRVLTLSCFLPSGDIAGFREQRVRLGAALRAVRRGRELLLNPGADFRLEAGDTAILVGDHPQVDRALCLLDPTHGEPV
jgi:K+/H+ antiporter YhaU regulatory subunit KhtT